MTVTSTCWIVVEGVNAARSDTAMEIARNDEIAMVIAALSVGSADVAYRVEMISADDGTHGETFSTTSSSTQFLPAELTTEELETAQARITLMAGHKDLAVASKLFDRGLRLSDLLAGELSISASILAFYQVLEACSRLVPWAAPNDYDERRTMILGTLRKELDGRGMVKNQAAAVVTANAALSRLEAKYTSLRIEHAADKLGLDRQWIERERELGTFRNSKLGHANTPPTLAQMSGWGRLDVTEPLSAYGLASTMLAAAFG